MISTPQILAGWFGFCAFVWIMFVILWVIRSRRESKANSVKKEGFPTKASTFAQRVHDAKDKATRDREAAMAYQTAIDKCIESMKSYENTTSRVSYAEIEFDRYRPKTLNRVPLTRFFPIFDKETLELIREYEVNENDTMEPSSYDVVFRIRQLEWLVVEVPFGMEPKGLKESDKIVYPPIDHAFTVPLEYRLVARQELGYDAKWIEEERKRLGFEVED